MYQARLESQQLLTGEDMRIRLKPWKLGAYLLILVLCFYKLIAALLNGYTNVIFLVIFGIAGVLLTKFVSNLPRLTKLGKQHLERLQLAFDSLKTKTQTVNQFAGQPQNSVQPAFAGVDPLLLGVGVFGGAFLAGTAYDSYNQAFQRAQNQTAAGSCGSGCGTSCSSDGGSSSCSGGSSCGGGGCGGCGGS